MPTYLMLTTLTEKGVQTLHANPARLAEVNRDVEEMGAKVLHQWAALGEYDFVNIVEAPDDLTIAKVSIALGARGSAKLESLPLIAVDDFLSSLASSAATGRGSRSGAARPGAGSSGRPGLGSRLNSRGATSFGVSGWKSAARSWMCPRPGPSSHWPPP